MDIYADTITRIGYMRVIPDKLVNITTYEKTDKRFDKKLNELVSGKKDDLFFIDCGDTRYQL